MHDWFKKVGYLKLVANKYGERGLNYNGDGLLPRGLPCLVERPGLSEQPVLILLGEVNSENNYCNFCMFLSISVCFCSILHFLSVSVRFCMHLSVSVRFCPFLPLSVSFCLFLSVSVHFSLLLLSIWGFFGITATTVSTHCHWRNFLVSFQMAHGINWGQKFLIQGVI